MAVRRKIQRLASFAGQMGSAFVCRPLTPLLEYGVGQREGFVGEAVIERGLFQTRRLGREGSEGGKVFVLMRSIGPERQNRAKTNRIAPLACVGQTRIGLAQAGQDFILTRSTDH